MPKIKPIDIINAARQKADAGREPIITSIDAALSAALCAATGTRGAHFTDKGVANFLTDLRSRGFEIAPVQEIQRQRLHHPVHTECDAMRYRWLQARDLNTIHKGGVFAGLTSRNVILNGDDLDNAVDDAMEADRIARSAGHAPNCRIASGWYPPEPCDCGLALELTP